jgi:hypothetical protein
VGFDDHNHGLITVIRFASQAGVQRLLGGTLREQRLQEHLIVGRITMDGKYFGAYPHIDHNGLQVLDRRR